MTAPPPPSTPTLAHAGEDGLLARIFPRLPRGTSTLLGPGDDAAVVAAPDTRVVVSTDVLVEGRHFRHAWSCGEDVGRRAAVQNLADVAAMGASPTALVVGLVCPDDLPVAWVEGFADGLRAECAPDVGVVGGDLSGGSSLVVAVTVLGDLDGRDPVRRDGARPGDVVAHAGVRGRSAAGLALLDALVGPDGRPGEPWPDSLAAPGLRSLVDGYRRPVAPWRSGPVASAAGATAMLDVSDGLLRDAGRLARASGVVVDLDAVATAFPDDLAALAPAAGLLGADAAAWVLTGGEDHGLLATFPAGAVLPEGFRAVGTVRGAADGAPEGTVLVAGERPAHALTGWDHFGGR